MQKYAHSHTFKLSQRQLAVLAQSSSSDCVFSKSDELCARLWTGKSLERAPETEAWQLFGDGYQPVAFLYTTLASVHKHLTASSIRLCGQCPVV